MLRVSPQVFQTLLWLIEDHPVFQNNSNNFQTPVETQLAVTLYQMGCFGNGASSAKLEKSFWTFGPFGHFFYCQQDGKR